MMLPMRSLVAGLGGVVLVAADHPSSQDVRDAMSELSQNLTECHVYYMIGAQCARNAGSGAAADLADKIAKQTIDLEIRTGKAGGVSDEALKARARLSTRALMESTRNSCANMSILIERYAQYCRVIVEHPDLRLNEILKGYRH